MMISRFATTHQPNMRNLLTPANPTAFKTLLFSCAVNTSYVFLSALPMVPGSGCRAGGPLERAEGRELVTAGPRLAGILLEWMGLGV